MTLQLSRHFTPALGWLTLAIPVLFWSRPARAIDDQYPAAGVCAWPSIVHVVGNLAADHWLAQQGYSTVLCSGTYIGNRVVVTGAHCVAQTSSIEVRFGEEFAQPFYSEQAACVAHPDGQWDEIPGSGGVWEYHGQDIAYCVLSAAAPVPPYAPVMVPNGCEAQYIRDRLFGADADIYGVATKFVAVGDEEDPNGIPFEDIEKGTKRFCGGGTLFEDTNVAGVLQVISLQPGNEAGPVDSAIGVWPGDSGGALMFPMPNLSWRLIGTLSKHYQSYYDLDGPGSMPQVKRNTVGSASTPRYLKWIEDSAGRDVTPCHTWAAATNRWTWTGPATCGSQFDTSPATASGSWPSCSSGTVTTSTECSGWTPPGPDNKTAPSEADLLLDLAQFGAWHSTSDMFGADKLPRWTGTVANDSFTSSTFESNETFGGRGNDTLFVGLGEDENHGGSGNDLLVGGLGNDVLVPGRGLDVVQGDLGNDKIIIQGRCEIVAGESINGGPGIDVLYSPVDLPALNALGVTVTSIESVVINHADLDVLSCSGSTTLGLAVLQ